MVGFFKGWRRKTGCVTLVFAIGFLAALVRSLFVLDTFDVRRPDSAFGLKSCLGFIEFDSTWGLEGDSVADNRGFEWRSVKLTNGGSSPTHQLRFHWNLEYATNARILDFQLPYWSVILSLTVLSACLMLAKPRG